MRFDGFQVKNFRNILDSGWIEANQITAFVGQNEAGKSNLFEALYALNPIIPGADYSADEDWPVDNWEGRREARGKLVCSARFNLDADEIAALWEAAGLAPQTAEGEAPAAAPVLPTTARVVLSKHYGHGTSFHVYGFPDDVLDADKANVWCKSSTPKFVYIHEYDMSGTQVELDQLKQRLDQVGGDAHRHMLSNEDQTILVILDLANIDLGEFLQKGESAAGRTVRSFDKRSASSYLTRQFANLWQQKKVKFDIEIDGPTLNIFAQDEAVGMPVRLNRRSTGFRWYVSFAWKFTHATRGEFANCVILLEEPGVHLHFSGQRDLLKVFERLAAHNTLLYTTHLASMVELSNPERVRIVESRNGHLAITQGIVSSQREPMAVIEHSLGLTGDQSGLLSNRQVLIVEGGDDAVVLHKVSGLMRAAARESLSDRIYLWPAHGATKTPMYAGFAIGQGWDAGVLLDTDHEGKQAKKKIDDLYVSKFAAAQEKRFRTIMLGAATGSKNTDFAIEDIFGDKFYMDCINATFGLAIRIEDLPEDGSDMITKKVEKVLIEKYHHAELDKRRVMGEMWKRFDQWKTVADLPSGTVGRAEKLFRTINALFAENAS